MTLKNNRFKWIFIVVFVMLGLSLLFSGCSKNEIDNDWSEYNLKGRVRSVKWISYRAIDRLGEIIKGDKENENGWDVYYSFNNKGNIVEQKRYSSDGYLANKSIYKYNDKGNLIKEILLSRDGENLDKAFYKYDENGNKIVKHYFLGDAVTKALGVGSDPGEKTVYKYDDKGNLIEEISYRFGEISGKTINTYDEQGNMIESNEYKSGEISGKTINTYDEQGNMIESNEYKSDGDLSFKTTYKYDDKGNLIEIKKWYHDEISFKTIYNDRGNLVEKRDYDDGTISKKRSYKYDYDKKGNWVKRIEFINEIPKYIEEREIEYF